MQKNLLKWSISILATLVVILLSYAMGVMFGFTSFIFSWELNFLLMIWYTLLVSQIKPKLNLNYFKVKPFEKDGKLYKYFGVYLYRKLLVWVGWEKISRKNNPVKNDRALLSICEHNTRLSELGHTLIAIIVFITTICVSSSLNQAKWLIITNILLNIYPIMVQRFNRPRYTRIINDGEVEQSATTQDGSSIISLTIM